MTRKEQKTLLNVHENQDMLYVSTKGSSWLPTRGTQISPEFKGYVVTAPAGKVY